MTLPDCPALRPSAVRAIVFDLDGTLIDSYAAIAESLNHARAAFGLPALDPDRVRAGVGRGLEALIRRFVGEDRVAEGVSLFRHKYAAAHEHGTVALPGAADTLAELHARGLRMAVASNKPARFSEPILRRLGLLEFLDSVMGPDLVGSTKPEPAMLHRCLESLRVEPAASLYVGDMVLDVETAARARVPVVLVAGGSSSVEELRATGLPVLGSLREIGGLLAPGR